MTDEVNPTQLAKKWTQELKLSKREDEKWVKRGKKVIKRYRDDRTGWSDNAKRYNILWSNVQTILPALYGKTPKAQVERRYKDQDPVGRTAAQIMERALQFEIDHKGEFDQAIRAAIMDRLLPGRGACWVRFEAAEEMQTVDGPRTYECTPVDYVYWEDFRCSPARTWDEVTWVARRVYMSKSDVVARFGEEHSDVPMTHEPIGLEEMQKNGENVDSLRKAQVWEIWDKGTKTVTWVADGYSKALDHRDDPYGLDTFWPCPKPLYATQTTDTLVPVPDYALYQDQADEIDLLTQRINMLVKALKVVGVYDASQVGVQRMLNEGVDNTLIPVDSWAAFSEKGGIKGVVDFLPLDQVINALQQCYMARDQAKQVIYEVTGLSDIIRGASVASETATAQQIKSQYASLRLRDLQRHVAVFASDLLKIKAQLMCDFYAPETLVEMSGIMGTQDAQFVEPAMQMLKSEPGRNYRVEVASDSMVEIDEQTEKQSRMEFLQATGGFLQQAIPAAMQAPELAPLFAEMLMFGVRAFKGGRPMEAAFDTAMAQMSAPKPPAQPVPDPEQIKAQAQMQVEAGKMQLEQAKMESTGQMEQAKLQAQMQSEQVKMQAQMQIEQFKAEQAAQLEMLKQQAETERAQMAADIEARTKILIAQIQAMQAQETASQEPKEDGKANESMQAMAEMHQQMLEGVASVVQALKSPKRKILERDGEGRAIGVIEIEQE